MIPTVQLAGLGRGANFLSPFSIFGPGDTGAFYDFTDSATVFADSARTTQSTVGGQIFGVTDKSGTGRHLSGANAGILRGQSAGIDYGSFPGSGIGLVESGGQCGSSAGYYCIVACRPTTLTGAYLFDMDHSTQRVSQTINPASGVSTLVWNGSAVSFSASGGTIVAGADVTISTLRTATAGDIRLNGTVVGTTAGTTTAATFTSLFALGSGWAGTSAANNAPFTGRIYAAFLLNRQPTATELAFLESWFAAKLPLDRTLAVPSGSIVLTGQTPGVGRSIIISPPAGSITVTGQAPTITGALDSYTSGIWAAVGLTKVLSSYSGPAIRVRKSTGGDTVTEQDIGFSGFALDTTALASFVGSETAVVTKWYDQSGNGNDFTNATTSTQPRIVNAGTYDGAVKFNTVGSADMLLSVNSGGTVPTKTVFRKLLWRSTSGTQVAYEYGNASLIGGAGGNGQMQYVNTAGAYSQYIAANSSATAYSARGFTTHEGTVTPSAIGTLHARGGLTGMKTYSSAGTDSGTGGSDVGGGDGSAATNFPAQAWRIGKRSDGFPALIDAYSFVVYDADQSANGQAISIALA